MIYKLHTSALTEELFKELNKSIGLQPFILSKLALAMAIRQGKLEESDFQTDNSGLELNRQTIFGEYDLIFKCLITLNENEKLLEDKYFPGIVKAYLDKGALLLHNEFRYSKDFYNHLCQLDHNL